MEFRDVMLSEISRRRINDRYCDATTRSPESPYPRRRESRVMRARARRGMGSVSRGDREWTLGTGGREGWDQCLGNREWMVGTGGGSASVSHRDRGSIWDGGKFWSRLGGTAAHDASA